MTGYSRIASHTEGAWCHGWIFGCCCGRCLKLLWTQSDIIDRHALKWQMFWNEERRNERGNNFGVLVCCRSSVGWLC